MATQDTQTARATATNRRMRTIDPCVEVTNAETPPGQVGAGGGESVPGTHCIALQHFLEQHHWHGWVRGGAERVAEDRYRAWGCCACGAAWER
jgi:hypothetical protein